MKNVPFVISDEQLHAIQGGKNSGMLGNIHSTIETMHALMIVREFTNYIVDRAKDEPIEDNDHFTHFFKNLFTGSF